MATYKYTAQDAAGVIQRGSMEAASTEEVLGKIKGNRLYPVKVSKVRHAGRRKGVKDTQVITFFQDLAGLLESGLPMDRALGLAMANQSGKAFAPTLADVTERVQKGDDLSDALATHADVFGEMAPHLVRAGEMSGQLHNILLRIAEHMEQVREFRQKLISALVYPCILLSVSIISIVVLLIFVIPKFGQIFLDMNQEIPGVTKFLLDLGTFVSEWGYVIPLILLGIFFGGKALLARPDIRLKVDELLVRTPVLKTFFINKELSRFFRTLGILIAGGVPLVRAIGLVEKVLTNGAVKAQIAPLRTEVKVGRSLSWYFRQNEFFPQQVGAMIYIAEEQGRLADGLLKLGERFQNEFQVGVERLTAMAEPLVIVMTGLFIGVAVLSMFSAIFGITDIPL